MTRQDASSEFEHVGVLPDAASVGHIIEHSSDIAVHVDAQDTVIGIFVSPECPAFGCLDHWVGRKFETFLNVESKVKYAARRQSLAESPQHFGGPLELNHYDNADWEFPVRYVPLPVNGGETLLLIGRDMQPVAEIQQRLVNEQLARERDKQRIRSAETFFRVVLEASETPLILVDPDTGRIRDANRAAAALLGAKPDTLTGSALNQAFEGRRRSELMETLQAAGSQDDRPGVDLVARRNDKPVVLYPEYFRAAGELGLLCRLASTREESAGGTEVAEALSTLFDATSDAIVLLDSNGMIREANEAFLVMADAAQLRDIRDRPFSDFLVRGGVNSRLLMDSTRREGRIRSFMAQFRSVVGSRTTVDISTAKLTKGGRDQGVGLILRDVSGGDLAVEGAAGAAVSEEALKNVMDLVGTASLKELVSATSDVIERMCIDTALQLTKNNRVAAAEMLGLSRQSLYVKLRKYDMLNGEPSDTGSGDQTGRSA